MRYLTIILMFISILNANAGTNEINHWISESNKTIYYTIRPATEIVIQKLEIDKSYWASLSVVMEFRGVDNKLIELQEVYPNYKFKRVQASAGGSALVKVSSINYEKEIEVLDNMEGPFFNHSFFLTKAQFETIMEEIKADESFISLEGVMNVSVPTLKIVEKRVLKEKVCHDVLKDGEDLISFSKNYLALIERVSNDVSIIYPQTKKSIINSILKNCFNKNISGRFDSLTDLLNQKIEISSRVKAPVGVTKRMKSELKVAPMQFNLSTKILE